MSENILVTGCSGFLGRELIKVILGLDISGIEIFCTLHSTGLPVDDKRLKVKKLDLGNKDEIVKFLKSNKINTILHMAALTGKGRKKDHFYTNYELTRNLIEAAKESGIRRFIFVSTIAVKFKDMKRYYYAIAKKRAEEELIKSNLDYVIVRPTMIFGNYSPILDSFFKLALLPFPIIFGNGKTVIQPVHVKNVANVIIRIILNRNIKKQIFEVGGKEKITIEDLISLIRKLSGKKTKLIVRIPILPISVMLGVLENVLMPILPFTVGQLRSFNNDGIASKELSYMKFFKVEDITLIDMIREFIKYKKNEKIYKKKFKEARMMLRYLTKRKVNEDVLGQIAECCTTINFNPENRFDKILNSIAFKSRIFLKVVDSFSSIFYKNSTVRRKLVYSLAIMEVSSEYFDEFLYLRKRDGFIKSFLYILFSGFGFILSIFFSFIMFTPLKCLKLCGKNEE